MTIPEVSSLAETEGAQNTSSYGLVYYYGCDQCLKISRRGSQGSIILVALSRPHVRNAFHDALYNNLIQLLHETAQDDSVAALVLTGEGSYFSSGADLSEARTLAEPPPHQTSLGRHTLSLPPGRFMMALLSYPKIVAAAVQGPAVGIGATLLLHCDLVHCTDRATFWVPFTRLALVPELCSSVTLLESMGLSKANELLLLGKPIDAHTAMKWNICSHVRATQSPQAASSTSSSAAADLSWLHDPFHPDSLASQLGRELEERLLSLPGGPTSARVFTQLIKGRRRERMMEICREELGQLDARFNRGEVARAFAKISIGSAPSSTRSTPSSSSSRPTIPSKL